MGQSILKNQRTPGILSQMSRMGGHSPRKKNAELGFSLNLTTLIDAFCILVIFLLSNMSQQTSTKEISSKVKLPQAQFQEMINEGLVVQVQPDGFSINDIKLTLEQVTTHLIRLKEDPRTAKEESLIIQADKGIDFTHVGDFLRAAGQAGFSKFIFAVRQKTK